jgi:hypothetical protein
MKNQAIQYLAFDVHQATVVASVRDESGKVVLRATMATEAKVILAFVKNAGPHVHVAFEEGTQAQWLYDLLIDHAERVIVCNVRGRSETTNKSDRIDADALSEQLRRRKSVPPTRVSSRSSGAAVAAELRSHDWRFRSSPLQSAPTDRDAATPKLASPPTRQHVDVQPAQVRWMTRLA